MRGQISEDAWSDRGGYEFFPPIEFPDTWGVAWDAHLSATTAWQAADGNAQRQCEAPIRPATEVCGSQAACGEMVSSGVQPANATLGGLVQMDALLESLREQIQQVQTRLHGLISTEKAMRPLTRADQPDAQCGDEMGRLHPDTVRTFGQLAHLSFDVLKQGQQSARALFGAEPRASNSSLAPMSLQVGSGDCHPSAMILDFPERRAPN